MSDSTDTAGSRLKITACLNGGKLSVLCCENHDAALLMPGFAVGQGINIDLQYLFRIMLLFRRQPFKHKKKIGTVRVLIFGRTAAEDNII